MTFEVKAVWGADKFENKIPSGTVFPKASGSVDARYDGWKIIDYQLERLAYVRTSRLEILRDGYLLSNVKAVKANRSGIEIHAKVSNITKGHNTPTGFTGERLVWLRITVTDADGKVVFLSGDVDSNGDVRDNESSFVHAGELPLDEQLFNL